MKKRTLKLSALSLFVLASFMTFINSGLAWQQGDKPAEQVRKNIQVLKGLPDSQVIPVMEFMSTSLGVNCAFCHVNTGGQWDFAKDDKPEKLTARKMIQMQFGINKGNKDIFGATGAVSCFTCHRGQTKPEVMPMLPVSAPSGGAPGTAKAAEPLPTVDQVLDKYVQAMGGRAAIEKVKSRVMKGQQIIGTETIPVETYQAAPDKVVSILTTPRQGVVMSGYNGKVGWVKNQRGQRELSGAQLAEMKRGADFYGDLKLKEVYPGLEVVDREKVGDRDAFVLASQSSPNRIEKLYFDTQTGLLIRIQTITQTLLAPIPEQMDFEDYRDVDGVKLPFTIRQSSVDARDGWTRKYTEIKQNVPVEDARFNPPPPAAAPAAAAPTPTPQ